MQNAFNSSTNGGLLWVKYTVYNLHQYKLRIKSNEIIKTNPLFLFLILSNIGNAQDMAKGFTNLEKEFDKAEVFFKTF
jgi:hypothetical protein